MGALEVLLYGLIQGATEFLPVSSSGHLALLPKIREFRDPGVIFDLAMHLGTAAAIGLYFYQDVKKLLRSTLRLFLTQKIGGPNDALCANMIMATFVTGVLGLVLREWALTYGRNPAFIAFNLIFFGILMAWADGRFLEDKDGPVMSKFQPVKAGLIGLFQVMAIFPGVSRSGSTLTISRVLGLSRLEAGRFSFLLSLPLILAGSLLEFSEQDFAVLQFSWSDLILGVALSFAVGLLTIHYFLKWISQIGLWPFALYRIFLGAAVYFFLT